MSFFRHREIFRSDVIRLVRERRNRRSRPHRLDEFPVGYSSADCSPAGSASASPTVDHSALKSSCRSIPFHRTVNSVLTVCLSLGDHPSISVYAYSPSPLRIHLQTSGSRASGARILGISREAGRGPRDKAQVHVGEEAAAGKPAPRYIVADSIRASSKIATARVQPAEAARIFTGKQQTKKPSEGSFSRLCSFSR